MATTALKVFTLTKSGNKYTYYIYNIHVKVIKNKIL